ncbi:glycosyltransferase family 4 protein [Flavobacterium sp. WC2509]|uniref:glycosyltransferase family 4 protein n=1 Tax=Flavobacterium sp. WC2509 TaxID=3461406 RepID=UPI0040440F60
MHIAILAPSHQSFIVKFLPGHNINQLPEGVLTAPFIGTIIEELLLKNHIVTAITTTVALDGDYKIKRFKSGNFEWIVVPYRPRSVRFNGKKIGRILDLYDLEQRNMAKCIKEVSPDIVHAHWSYEYAGAAVQSGFPHLITIHDNAYRVFWFFKKMFWFGRLIMSELILNKVEFASTVSSYMLPYVQKRCKSVKIIPNPTIVSQNISEIESTILIKLESLSNPRIIMINNGWDVRKNGKAGLLAFQQLQKKIPDATLHLFGNGSELDGIAYQEASNLGLQNVSFYGLVGHQHLKEELKKAHLLLHPSLEESFGVILIEAMSFGIPAIGGIRSGAVPWVLNDTRLLVDVSNPKEIGDKLQELLTNVALYKQIAMVGFDNVLSRFSSESVVESYIKYYNEILNNHNSKC